MMLDTLRYLAATIRHRDLAALGFVASGLGIEDRIKRFKGAWGSHLHATKSAQQLWQTKIPIDTDGSCSVLGAGRLHDLDSAALLARFNRISLVDANPLALSAWRMLKRQYPRHSFSFHNVEVTGLLFRWKQTLESVLLECHESSKASAWSKALLTIREIPTHFSSCESNDPRETFISSLHSSDAILSLNLLSQIPLGWQHVVESALSKRFGRKWVENHESEWLQEYFVGANALLKEHLALLARCDKSSILLIYDIENLNFELSRQQAHSVETRELFQWKTLDKEYNLEPYSGTWSINSAFDQLLASSCLQTESIDPLCNINLQDESSVRNYFPNHTPQWIRPWVWNISPACFDPLNKGSVHLVGGLILAPIFNSPE